MPLSGEAIRTMNYVDDITVTPAELQSQLELFCMLARMPPPRTIVVTPTNALSITDLASCTYRSPLCFGLRGPLTPDATHPLALIAPASVDPVASHAVEQFL